MNREEMMLEELRVFVHKQAKIQRKKAAENGVFVSIRKLLNTIFDPENVDIAFCDETELIQETIDRGRAAGIYLDDRGDFQWFKRRILANLHFKLTIRFPEILLRNSENKTHLIRDLFVRVLVSAEGRLIANEDGKFLWGTRASFSAEEVMAGYGHSHLRMMQFNLIEFQTFCTGSGDINGIMARMASNFDENLFTQFCHCLKVYLAWESLEGVPYIKFGNIAGSRHQGDHGPFPEVDVPNIYAFWREKLRQDDAEFTVLRRYFKITISDNKFEISLSQVGASYLVDKITQSPDFQDQKYFAIKGSNGVLVPLVQSVTNLSDFDQEKTVLVFRNKEIKLQLLNSNINFNELSIFLNPRITDGFSRILSDRFNDGFVREYALIPQCPSLNP